MRRSIFAAIMALFCLTSCVLDDGHTPNYDNSSKLIYDYATNTIYNKCTQNAAEVIYADALLRGDSETADIVKELFFSKYTTTIEGNNILIVPNIDTYYYTTIKTDGKPLSEGGQWSVYINIERNLFIKDLCELLDKTLIICSQLLVADNTLCQGEVNLTTIER